MIRGGDPWSEILSNQLAISGNYYGILEEINHKVWATTPQAATELTLTRDRTAITRLHSYIYEFPLRTFKKKLPHRQRQRQIHDHVTLDPETATDKFPFFPPLHRELYLRVYSTESATLRLYTQPPQAENDNAWNYLAWNKFREWNVPPDNVQVFKVPPVSFTMAVDVLMGDTEGEVTTWMVHK